MTNYSTEDMREYYQKNKEKLREYQRIRSGVYRSQRRVGKILEYIENVTDGESLFQDPSFFEKLTGRRRHDTPIHKRTKIF